MTTSSISGSTGGGVHPHHHHHHHHHPHHHSCLFCDLLIYPMQYIANNLPLFSLLIFALGALSLFLFFKNAILPFIRRRFSGRRNLRQNGEWCVVTGATDGIGRAISLQLAMKNFKIIVVGRSQEKLNETKALLLASGAEQVEMVCVDFAKETSEKIREKIMKSVDKKDVGVLVNNVGISYPTAQYFYELEDNFLDDIVNINIRAMFIVTKAIYPGMVERKRGLIVFTGSGASEIPTDPLYCAYASTKAASVSFAKSLQAECRKENVVVQCHTPLLVTSKLSKIRKSSFTVPTAEKYASCALKEMERGFVPIPSSPFCTHKVMIYLTNMLPEFLWRYIRWNQVVEIRKRALAKKKQNE